MRPFAYEKVRTEREAIAAARRGGRYIAGGITLIDLMREEVEHPDKLVDINELPLRGVHDVDGDLMIGALARMADVAIHPAVLHHQPLVAEALLEGASPQLRNVATIGGNLMQRVRCPYFRMRDARCNKREPGTGCAALGGVNDGHAILGTSGHCIAVHPSDLAVSLVALDGVLQVSGPDGERSFPVEELYRLPATTPHLEHTLRPGELILGVRLPGGPPGRRARYLKVRDRASYEFAVVSVAAMLDVRGGVIREARLAAGGVGTRPWRMRACEASLVGRTPGREAFEAAAELSILGARPLAGNRYKVELLRRTMIRALELVGEAE